MNILSEIVNFAMPSYCSVCGHVGDWVCKSCLSGLNDTLPECYACRRLSNDYMTHKRCLGNYTRSHLFTQLITWKVYDSAAKSIMSAFKYKSTEAIAKVLVREFVNDRKRLFEKIHTNAKGKPILLIPMPIHAWRRNKRGFNQAEALVAEFARQLGWFSSVRLIKRIRNTPHQARLDKEHRQANIKNSFNIDQDEFNSIKLLAPHVIVVVDDVISTGSTINEVGRIVKEAFPDAQLIALALFRGRVWKWETVLA